MSAPNQSRIAFWLLPSESDYTRLKLAIDTYAERLGTPIFEPHLTLLARPANDKDDPAAELEQLAHSTRALSLTGSGMPQWGPLYNQAFVLPYNRSPELNYLIEKLHPQQMVPDDYFPHVSLVYANLEPELGKQMIQEYPPGKRPVRFDRIGAVRMGPSCACDEDVRSWEPVVTVQLAQKES